MKKTLCIFAAAIVAALFSMTGCENESVSEHAMSVDPSYSKMGSSGSLTLTAHGGWNYHWSISEGSIGSLSKTTGNSVVYTAHGEGTQKITVSANTSSTNSTPLNATATIIQGGGAITSGSEADAKSELKISSSASTAIPGGVAVILTASGGDGAHYKWSIWNTSIGTLNHTTGSSVAYSAKSGTATAAQQITVNCGSQTATLSLPHSGAGIGDSELRVSSRYDFATPGGTALVLSASGGDGVNYKWSLAYPDIGTLNMTTGASVAYSAKAGTYNKAQQVIVKSGARTATLSIPHTSP